MPENVSVVLVRGAWAGGSSWAEVIGPPAAEGVVALAAPLPLTSFSEDADNLKSAVKQILRGHRCEETTRYIAFSGERLG